MIRNIDIVIITLIGFIAGTLKEKLDNKKNKEE